MGFKNWYNDKYFETKLGYFIHGNCLDVLETLNNNGAKFDAVITDVPQGITKNDWDKPIPPESMWTSLYQVRRSKATPMVIFSNQPFTTDLISSNREHFKYMRYWRKTRPTNFLNAKTQPLKDIEEIVVFYEEQCTYNP